MIELDGSNLTINEVVNVARYRQPVTLAEAGYQHIKEGRKRLDEIISRGEPVYGINTGFGVFADQRIPAKDLAQLNRNLVLSHAVGTGDPLTEEVVRAAMVVRANTLTKGYSGVRVEVVETLIDMLNRQVTPVVPSQGSLGSSGDLCPLSHLALVFTTDDEDREEDSGMAWYIGEKMTGRRAMQLAGIRRIHLGAKEGLAINNGATFSAAIAALAVDKAEYMIEIADIATALSLEAMVGCSSAFDPRIQLVRGHEGQITVARKVMCYIEGSTLVDSFGRIQDAYSLRCAPQVQGAARDTFGFVRKTVQTEVNAAIDNPLIFENSQALSGGNFHGEPIGMAMDFLGIAIAEVAAISERRVFRLVDSRLNGGLPTMLVDHQEAAGLNSGLMMPQYTAASLVLENQTLATPDSVRSLPTSAEQEDHNANSMTAARHAQQIIENTTHVLAIELYTAARAIDLRLRRNPNASLGIGTRAVYEQIREVVPYQAGDAWWGPEIQKVRDLLDNRSISPACL